MRPYVPHRYAICTSLDGLPAAGQALLRGKEWTYEFRGQPDQGSKCFDVTTEDARALDEILADAGFQYPSPAYGKYWPGSTSASVLFNPILPHGTWLDQPG